MTFLEKLFRSKAFVVTLVVLPGLWPAWPIAQQNPTVLADPLKYILHHWGFLACVLLVAVLSLTPLRVLWPKVRLMQVLNRHRRLVGVSAFGYAMMHFFTHIVYEGGFGVLASNVTKPFLVSGMVALSILLVLAITSPAAAVRRLGGRRWKNLHRLVYLAAILAAYHQAAAHKIFPMQVVWLFGPLALLELLRVFKHRRVARSLPVPLSSPGASRSPNALAGSDSHQGAKTPR